MELGVVDVKSGRARTFVENLLSSPRTEMFAPRSDGEMGSLPALHGSSAQDAPTAGEVKCVNVADRDCGGGSAR